MNRTRGYFEQERTGETEKFFSPSVISVFSCSVLFLLLFTYSAFAHEVRPAYLELRQTGPDTYNVLWKVPGLGDEMRLGVYVTLPEGSTNLYEPRGVFVNGAFIERWTVTRAGGLTSGTIHIAGLSATTIDVLVRMERLDGSTQLARLTPSSPSFVVEATPRKTQVVRTYLPLGVEVGQLLFIASVFAVVAVARHITRRVAIPQPVWAWRVVPYTIGGVSAFWVIQRIAAF